MTWSTRQLAELAGTTLKTVRHYHQIGLLEEPERASNGYKQYEVSHLVRLLRIKRLVDLGVPLAQIATMGQADDDAGEALRIIDAELGESVKRLQMIRAELALIRRHQAPTDLPTGFSGVAADLPDPDRAMLLIYSQVFDPTAMDDVRQMLQDSRNDPVDAELDSLAPDADDQTRQDLAERYAPLLQALTARYPWIEDPGQHAPRGRAFAESILGQAIADLYNPAQLDVLQRSYRILQSTRSKSAT